MIFLVALFWKKATTLSVLVAAILSVVMSVFIQATFPEFPYIHRMGAVFFASGLGCYLTSLAQGYIDQQKAVDLNGISFSTTKAFNLNTLIIVSILTVIYVTFG